MFNFHTDKPQSFFCRIPVVLETHGSSRTLDPPPPRSAPVFTRLNLLRYKLAVHFFFDILANKPVSYIFTTMYRLVLGKFLG